MPKRQKITKRKNLKNKYKAAVDQNPEIRSTGLKLSVIVMALISM